MTINRTLWALAGAVGLFGCAAYAPPAVSPGQSAEEVIRVLGEPTARYGLRGGGGRLEYARGPYGKHTWMVEVDANERVTRVLQVLTEEQFSTITPGTTREDVLATLGRPSEDRGARGGVRLWSYRYESWVCQWFVISMNPDGRVRDTGYAIDPKCDAGDGRDRS